MSTPVLRRELAGSSALPRARTAGVFYLLTFGAGVPSFFVHNSWGVAAGLLAGACYIAVTLLFYYIFKTVDRKVSFIAASLSLLACALGPLSMIHLVPSTINPLVLFGSYCLLIGYLIFRSRFLPPVLGVLMAFAGCGWLTFLSPGVAKSLSPYNLIPGFIGEGSLTVWLLLKGVDVQGWRDQTGKRTR